MEQKTRKGSHKAHDARKTEEEVKDRPEIIQSLWEGKAVFCQRVVAQKYLDAARGPTLPLLQVPFECLWHQTGGQNAIEIAGRVSLCMQVHAGVNVFGDGLGLKTADLLQRLSAEQATATREEGAVVRITAGL